MKKQILIFSILFAISITPQGQPIGSGDADVTQRYNDLPGFKENVLPYYGGLRGQSLQLIRTNDGTDNMFIIAPGKLPALLSNNKPAHTRKSSISITTDDIESLKKPSPTISFEQDFNRIQIAAARLVAIQEIAKRKGFFSSEDNRIYAESLLELGEAAQNLANLQKTGKIKDFSLLLKPDIQMPTRQPLVIAESTPGVENSVSEQKVEEMTEQQLNEEDILPPNTEDPYEDVSDTVAITAPKKDASVAEAKPVGLSIAGEGGVASSKPNAIALSGRNGLAVSAPKATAIAGVSAEEAAAFSVSIPNRNNLVIKAGNRISQRPVYDDYSEDYSDLPPIRSMFTRDVSVSHDSTTPVVSRKNKNNITKVKNTSSGADESFLDKWKTMIAEDYAASGRSAPLRNKQSVRDMINISQSSTITKV
ncbi:uncharacterized protein [Eurosta solidaginis]|uniref:uncharacterized protein isoform X2 n=1 Tax=Eurosta solidaginis TaxID=178769 RepID=UPI00353090F7